MLGWFLAEPFQPTKRRVPSKQTNLNDGQNTRVQQHTGFVFFGIPFSTHSSVTNASNYTNRGWVCFEGGDPKFLAGTAPFFPEILLSRKPPKTLRTWLVFERTMAEKKGESTPRKLLASLWRPVNKYGPGGIPNSPPPHPRAAPNHFGVFGLKDKAAHFFGDSVFLSVSLKNHRTKRGYPPGFTPGIYGVSKNPVAQ